MQTLVAKMVNALVISGYGINCERELAWACEMAGAKVQTLHAGHLLSGRIQLEAFELLLFPGGFSFGDELGAAKAFANRLIGSGVTQRLQDFVQEGGCILGICNGFQLLVKLGLLPGWDGGIQYVSLARNRHGRFDNRWVEHVCPPSRCLFTSGLTSLSLPIRHAEGRLVVQNGEVLERLMEQQQIALRYAAGCNPNGSLDDIAGICDSTGRILGMMAHPEAALLSLHQPRWSREELGPGCAIFKNVIHHLEAQRCMQR